MNFPFSTFKNSYNVVAFYVDVNNYIIFRCNRLKIANNNKEPRVVAVWSSGLTSTKCLPKDRFAVQVWGGSTWQENYDLIDNGFNVIFSHVDAWYLDCGFGNWRATGKSNRRKRTI